MVRPYSPTQTAVPVVLVFTVTTPNGTTATGGKQKWGTVFEISELPWPSDVP